MMGARVLDQRDLPAKRPCRRLATFRPRLAADCQTDDIPDTDEICDGSSKIEVQA